MTVRFGSDRLPENDGSGRFGAPVRASVRALAEPLFKCPKCISSVPNAFQRTQRDDKPKGTTKGESNARIPLCFHGNILHRVAFCTVTFCTERPFLPKRLDYARRKGITLANRCTMEGWNSGSPWLPSFSASGIVIRKYSCCLAIVITYLPGKLMFLVVHCHQKNGARTGARTVHFSQLPKNNGSVRFGSGFQK